MEKCPRCRRYKVEFDPKREVYRCLWRDCDWENKTYQDSGMTKEEKEKTFIFEELNYETVFNEKLKKLKEKERMREMEDWLIPITGLICLIVFIIGVIVSIIFAFHKRQQKYQKRIGRKS